MFATALFFHWRKVLFVSKKLEKSGYTYYFIYKYIYKRRFAMYYDMQYRVPYADTDQMGVVY